MRKSNNALKSRRRNRLSVEVLEARQLLATITVNTTLDNTPADSALSLRDAIEVSNGTLAVSSLSTQAQAQINGAVGATNTIDFDIPTTDPGYNTSTGVWTMAMQSALPATSTNAAIIDGYSQPGASKNTLALGDNAKLKIVLDGSNHKSLNGLTLSQEGSQVLGLDFQNFVDAGVLITAGGNVLVAGCFIGTDPSGETAAPNGFGVEIETSSNMIGAPDVGDRNVISGNTLGDGIYVPGGSNNPLNITPTGNVVENNYMGLDATGTKALANIEGAHDEGSGDTYGGTAPGTGNVISGDGGGGLIATGSITAEGNYVGTDVTGKVAIGIYFGVAGIGDFGLYTTTISTTISNNLEAGYGVGIKLSSNYQGNTVPTSALSPASFTVTDNLIGSNASDTAVLANPGDGVGIQLYQARNASILNNVIAGNEIGLLVEGEQNPLHDIIQGNFIGTDKTGHLAFGNSEDGINLNTATDVTIGGAGTGQANVIANNAGFGINSDGGAYQQFTRNSIFANAQGGITMNVAQTNNSIKAPHLTFAPGTGGSGTLSGTLTGTPNTSYVAEIFSNPTKPALGLEEGETFVKAVTVNIDGSGHGDFSLTEPVGQYYTATATDPSNDTSEFSNAVGGASLPASTTTVSSSANPATVGQQVTFTAVVSAPSYSGTPTGTVTFTIDGQAQTPVQLSVVGGVDEAEFTTSTLAAGSHTVSASYSGDTNVFASSGSPPSQTVTGPVLKASTTTVTSSADPSTVGHPVTFTAKVSAPAYSGTPTGTVIFTIDGHAQSPVPLALVAGTDEAQFTTSTLTVGSHTVSASYSGDAKVSGSSGSLGGQTVVLPALHATTTNLTSSLDPSTVGQPVTFTATVSPSGTTGSPSGSVTFTIDGVTQAPEQLHMVGGTDEATLTLASLTKGMHTIKAAYSGDSSFAGSAVASPLVQTVNAVVLPGGDGPTIVAVKRYGIHMQPTVVVVTFNDGLDPASAVNLSSYRITDPSGHQVRITSAVFDAKTNSVTLRTASRINLHHTYHFTVMGTGQNAVRNTLGVLLDGANTGSPGSNYSGTLDWRNVVLTPAEIQKYVHPAQFKPAGALNHRFFNRSR
jgi:hypothetical protein